MFSIKVRIFRLVAMLIQKSRFPWISVAAPALTSKRQREGGYTGRQTKGEQRPNKGQRQRKCQNDHKAYKKKVGIYQKR